MEKPVFASYARSPVREAIFSITFQTPLALERLRQFCAAPWAGQHYAPAEAEGDASEHSRPLGYVLHTPDRSALLRVTTTQLHYHQLGTYPGWETTSAAFLAAWQQLVTIAPEVVSQEAGIRYINRLGWDLLPGINVDLADYLYLLPNLPGDFPGAAGPFFLQVQALDTEQNLHGVITEVMELPDTQPARMEVVLDIRVSYAPLLANPVAVALPEFLRAGRAFKNQLFESCITPATRALFA